MKKYLFIFIGIFFFASSVHAATLSVELPSTFQVNSQTAVDVLVDPEGESINLVELTILFPQDILSFKGYDSSQINIPKWISSPKEKTNGEVSFSGIIPGGLERVYDPQHPNQHTIRLVRLLFTPQKVGSGQFTFVNSSLLRNDGQGSTISTVDVPQKFSVLAETHMSGEQKQTIDSIPPHPFMISIIDASLFGKTPRLAVFDAQDDASGIEHYESKINSQSFQIATNPLNLPFRLFSYTVTIRAFDFSGNYYDESIQIPGQYSYIPIIILFLATIIILFYNIKHKKIQKS